MKITFLCSDSNHPVNAYLKRWVDRSRDKHSVELCRTVAELKGGDFLFLVSCSEVVGAKDRAAYRWSLVLHASDLPKGRGWSPHIWQLIEGADSITLSLIEAEDKIDTGKVWKKVSFPIPQNALWDEINRTLFEKEIELIDFAVNNMEEIEPQDQPQIVTPTYYPRRNPENSRLDPGKTIAEQFDLLRVCDPDRFPAFFELRGRKYYLRIDADE